MGHGANKGENTAGRKKEEYSGGEGLWEKRECRGKPNLKKKTDTLRLLQKMGTGEGRLGKFVEICKG